LKVSEYRALRRTFGPKMEEVAGDWRRLHNEELRSLYPPPGVIKAIELKRMRWPGHVARIGDKRNACKILVGKPERRRQYGILRRG
jgi:hypothetical protein